MTKKELTRLANLIAAEACYGEKEHPVRLMTLHDVALSIARGFDLSEKSRAIFLEMCDLPAIPADAATGR
jgi:hypothetical protein